MSDIDTEPDTDAELEEQLYSESASNSEVSDSSSDDGNVSGSEETNSGTDSEHQGEGPVTNIRRGGRARVRGSRRGRGRGRGRVGIRGRREGRRGRRRGGTRSTEDNWTTVTGGKKMYKNKNKKNVIRIIVFSSTADTPPQTAAFTAQPGPKVDTSCKTPEECFSIFLDDNLLDFIVENTNKYAQIKMSCMQLTTFCLYRNWRPVTRAEMKGFLAIILNMGIIQLGDLKDYWSTDNTTNLPFLQSVFSHDRFFQIFGALHVGEIDSTTKRGKIQPFLDYL